MTFYAVDRAGNRSIRPLEFAIEVDARPPTLSISNEPNDVFLLRDVVVSGDATDDRDLWGVYLDYVDATGTLVARRTAECHGCASALSSPWDDSPPAMKPGRYEVVAMAHDSVGNRSERAHLAFVTVL